MEVSLTQGQIALIDDEDYELVSQYKWRYSKKKGESTGYAKANLPRHDGKPQKTILMHRLILNAQIGQHIDHANHNGLDNRRSNIRIASITENTRNRRTTSGSSKYKGVSWNTQKKRWKVAICADYKEIFLGYFIDEDDAARAYDRAAKEYHGEFACLNFGGIYCG